MAYYFGIVSLILGLVVGSFLNVVIYRLPRGESLLHPGSHCPQCDSPVRWYDNVPLLSWAVLRGRCRDCRNRISIRYPVVEAVTGAAFLLAYLRLGLGWPLLIVWAFTAAMVCVALIDHDHMIIPDKIVLPGAALGLLASIAISPADWWKFLVAGVGAAAFMFLLALVWPGGMGPGDIKMALFMGVVLGVSVVTALFVAFFVGAAAGMFLLATHRRTRKDQIPFGPYLALGSVLAVLAGQGVLNSYLALFG